MGSEEVGNPDDRLTRQNTVVLSGEAGVSERLSIQGALPIRAVHITGREDVSAEGIGDLELTVRAAVTDPEADGRVSLVAFCGAALPTGKDSDPDILEQNAQFSRGVYSAIAGGELNLPLGAGAQLYGRVETQVPVGDDDGYRFAATRSLTGLVSAPFGDSPVRWLGGLEFRYAGRDTTDVAGDGQGPIAVENRGGHQTRLVGGLLVGISRSHTVGLTAGYLLDADLHGDQITARTEIVVGWQGTFGTHRHRAED